MLGLSISSSCSKTDKVITTTPPDEIPTSPADESSKTPVGSPVGIITRKKVDGKGGQLSSADGRIQVIIPAGAVETSKEFSIQAITNELPGGVGHAFRLLPHGEQFKKSRYSYIQLSKRRSCCNSPGISGCCLPG